MFDTPHIIVVGDNVLRVGVVWVCCLNRRSKILRPEELADLSNGTGTNLESLVGEDFGVQVGEEVSVDSTAGVVTRENSVELDNAISIGLLNTSQVGGVISTRSVVSGS